MGYFVKKASRLNDDVLSVLIKCQQWSRELGTIKEYTVFSLLLSVTETDIQIFRSIPAASLLQALCII